MSQPQTWSASSRWSRGSAMCGPLMARSCWGLESFKWQSCRQDMNSKDDMDQFEVKLKDLVPDGILWEASNSSMLAYSPCLRFAKMLMLISGGLGDICILILLSFEQTSILQILPFLTYLHARHIWILWFYTGCPLPQERLLIEFSGRCCVG